MAEFVAGGALAAAFHAGVVGPPLHAATLWGPGSDVQGYDTAPSTDHGWGPRTQIFADDVARGVRTAAGRPGVEAGAGAVLAASSAQDREAPLVEAYETAARAPVGPSSLVHHRSPDVAGALPWAG